MVISKTPNGAPATSTDRETLSKSCAHCCALDRDNGTDGIFILFRNGLYFHRDDDTREMKFFEYLAN